MAGPRRGNMLGSSEQSIDDSRDIRPVPDPTRLTTQQLLRELNSLKEVISTRLDAMDKAIELFNANMTRVPTDVDKQVGNLERLHNEKFSSIEKQFSNLDSRNAQLSAANERAIMAALQAAKERFDESNGSFSTAVAKAEATTIKQIEQISAMLQSTIKTFDDKIADMKDRFSSNETRISGIEARTSGQGAIDGRLASIEASRSTQTNSVTHVFMAVGVVAAAVASVVAVVTSVGVRH
jgi:hypothetical protein